jgi:HEAT repeat protein
MRNALSKKQKPGDKSSCYGLRIAFFYFPQYKLCTMNNRGVLYTLFFICSAISVFGCSGSLQKTAARNVVSVDDLVHEATRIIQDGLADEDPRIRAKAVEVVAIAKRVELMPKVQRLLRDEFVPVRFSAALAVGELEYSLAEGSVKLSLKDQDENVRIAAAYAMTKLGFPDSFELLRKAITSSDQTVRANAALLLGKSGNKNALGLLYWVLRDKDSDDKVRFQAAEAIAMLGDERIYQKLWTMLISAYADDRAMGIKAMGALGTVQAKNALITMLDDDILEVRLVAAEQLGMLKDSVGEPEVLEVFMKNLTAGMDKDELEHVNMLAALAIGRIGTASLTRFLPQLLQSESKLVRVAAAEAVFQCIKKG